MDCIGIIGAMEEEVAALKEKMEQVEVTKKASMEFYRGVLEGKKAVVVRSGIGKVNENNHIQLHTHIHTRKRAVSAFSL